MTKHRLPCCECWNQHSDKSNNVCHACQCPSTFIAFQNGQLPWHEVQTPPAPQKVIAIRDNTGNIISTENRKERANIKYAEIARRNGFVDEIHMWNTLYNIKELSISIIAHKIYISESQARDRMRSKGIKFRKNVGQLFRDTRKTKRGEAA